MAHNGRSHEAHGSKGQNADVEKSKDVAIRIAQSHLCGPAVVTGQKADVGYDS